MDSSRFRCPDPLTGSAHSRGLFAADADLRRLGKEALERLDLVREEMQ
jgi:hypothetical protein